MLFGFYLMHSSDPVHVHLNHVWLLSGGSCSICTDDAYLRQLKFKQSCHSSAYMYTVSLTVFEYRCGNTARSTYVFGRLWRARVEYMALM